LAFFRTGGGEGSFLAGVGEVIFVYAKTGPGTQNWGRKRAGFGTTSGKVTSKLMNQTLKSW